MTGCRRACIIMMAGVVVSAAGCLVGEGRAAEGGSGSMQRPVGPADKSLALMFEAFDRSAQRSGRRAMMERILKQGPAAAEAALAFIGDKYERAEAEYMALLERHLRPAYLERLEALSDEQIHFIQQTRLKWELYLLYRGHRSNFQQNYLKPCMEVARLLLVDPAELEQSEVSARRGWLAELAEYYQQCQAALGKPVDPTAGKTSPTGVAYPPLDHVPTLSERLSYLERTQVLVATVAPPGARPVLMGNVAAAGQIDYEEAEFVLFANQVRMLVGSIAWSVDPLMCACARDHSTDRKAGRARGHSSTVPGKESFSKRLRYFGARGSSEGAGGGRSGRGYIWGLSYGGGHTGPLYSLKRNVVGVGRRGGVYTSIYATDRKLVHPCPVTTGQMFMPPGLEAKDVPPSLQGMYRAMQAGRYDLVRRLAGRLRQPGAYERMLVRFFAATVNVRAERELALLESLLEAGDVVQARLRMDAAKVRFKGIGRFDNAVGPLEEKLAGPAMAEPLRRGQIYYRLVRSGLQGDALKGALMTYVEKYGDSTYGKAARAWLEGMPQAGPFDYFVAQKPGLEEYGYPFAEK